MSYFFKPKINTAPDPHKLMDIHDAMRERAEFLHVLDSKLDELRFRKFMLHREIDKGHDEARDAFGELCRGISELEEMRDGFAESNVCFSWTDLIQDTPKPSMRHVLI